MERGNGKKLALLTGGGVVAVIVFAIVVRDNLLARYYLLRLRREPDKLVAFMERDLSPAKSEAVHLFLGSEAGAWALLSTLLDRMQGGAAEEMRRGLERFQGERDVDRGRFSWAVASWANDDPRLRSIMKFRVDIMGREIVSPRYPSLGCLVVPLAQARRIDGYTHGFVCPPLPGEETSDWLCLVRQNRTSAGAKS